jgi:hypothetical protein
MTSEVVKASKAVKGITSTVRQHLDAVERAREIYLAQIKRAESEYFDRIKHATALISGDAGETAAPPATPAASAAAPADASTTASTAAT